MMGAIKRRGVLLLLVVLPDGSRSLIPASWTNWEQLVLLMSCLRRVTNSVTPVSPH